MVNDEEITYIDPLSVSSVFIELFFDDRKLACGTAFFVEKGTKKYLVTNWHNLAGRNPNNLEVLDEQLGDTPNKIKIYKHDLTHLGQSDVIHISLLTADDKPLWFEHPVCGSKIDVAILNIPSEHSGNIITIQDAVEMHDPFEKQPVKVGERSFILGFPFGLSGSAYFPIWKAGFIASEPEININDLPFFYIDTATRQGMSGSPVIQRERRSVTILSEEKVSRYHSNFIGVYSGRIGAKDALAAQLGIVWKASCIDEIISGEKLAIV